MAEGQEDPGPRQSGDEICCSRGYLANRPRDVEDCVSLASAGIDYEAVYAEIEAQYAKVGTVEEKIWITYLEGGIGKLEEDYRVQVPIADKVSELGGCV